MGVAIAVASGKGGVGKTSVVAGLAACLAAMGKSVLCVDADIGLRNLDIVLGLSDKTALDFGDVLRGDVPPERALVAHPLLKGLKLLNAPYTLPDTADAKFPDLIASFRERFDFILIDCAAGLGRSLRMAASAADRAILVTTPDATSLRDAARTAAVFEELGVGKMGLVVNRIRPRLVSREEVPNIDDAMDVTGVPLLGIVPEDENVITGANRAQPLIMRSAEGAALAYYNIAQRLTGSQVPLMKLK